MPGGFRFSRRILLAGCSTAGQSIVSAARGSMIEGKEIVAVSGAVATEPEDATRAGASILQAGGNAMDAAAAACLVSGTVQPETSDIGGYVLCAVVLEGSSGHIWSLDADSAAPAVAHERMYEVGPVGANKTGINANEYACSVRDDANVFGSLAVAVPGVMAGIGTLWEKWGRLKWAQICAPAQRLLAEGFPYRSTADAIARMEPQIRRFEAALQHLAPKGRVPKPQDRWSRPDFAKTLNRLVSAGWRDFYEGETGRKIADYIRASGGILTREDLARYKPRLSDAYVTTYRGAKVYAVALPNGGLSCLQFLNMLECFESLPDTDAMYWHRLAEILKRGWRDRLRYFGDPAFVKVATERFLTKEYAAGRVETMRQYPDHVDRLPGPAARNSPGTVHISAGDRDGNLVAVTMSHGGLFGSCITVPGTGIILGHGMCRFDPHPGLPNSVAAGKRPLNNVAPMIVRLPDRDVALGLRGGRRIVSVSTQFAQRVIDYGATGREAVSAPRLHLEGHEPVELVESTDDKIVQKLAAMGHDVKKAAAVGGHGHIVELLREQHKIRAGGNVWAAGVE